MNFLKDENNLKWLIAFALCVMLLTLNVNIIVWGTDEMKKFLMIELFALLGVLVGYYWGSSKGSQDKDKNKKDEEFNN